MTGQSSGIRSYFVFPVAVMLVVWAAALALHGAGYLATIMILTAVEVTFSFDNATIDAKLLGGMTNGWQQAFLTVGPIIGVGLVRMIFPIALVAVTTALGFGEVWFEAWHNQALYQLNVEQAHGAIVALAAPFLGLTFLTWVMDPDKDVHWPVMAQAERRLQRVGRGRPYAGVLLVVATLITVIAVTDASLELLVFGLVSVGAFMLVHWLNMRTERSLGKSEKLSGRSAFSRGFSQLLRLELVDASFSLDSVSGAFAITNSFPAILLGLGVGALFVRAFTKLAVDRGTLQRYVYLEHGAHWSIGALAVLLPLSVAVDIPEFLTGAISVGVILLALLTSAIHARRQTVSA